MFRHGDVVYTAGLGFFDDDSLAEIFLNGAKADSDLDIAARDAAVAVSIALQYGCPLIVLLKSMARNPDGGFSSPLGKVLSMVVKKEI